MDRLSAPTGKARF